MGGGWNLNRTIYSHYLADLLTAGHLSKVRRRICAASVLLVLVNWQRKGTCDRLASVLFFSQQNFSWVLRSEKRRIWQQPPCCSIDTVVCFSVLNAFNHQFHTQHSPAMAASNIYLHKWFICWIYSRKQKSKQKRKSAVICIWDSETKTFFTNKI